MVLSIVCFFLNSAAKEYIYTMILIDITLVKYSSIHLIYTQGNTELQVIVHIF